MTGENAPVREVPGFARVGQAAKRAFLGLTTPLFGTPGEPTKLGKAMDLVDEAASVGLMTYGASAARLGRAAERASLVARGARPQTVLRRTGYQKGPFGYGVETRGDAYFRPSALFDGGEGVVGRLGDVADVHPDVAMAYPGVERDVAVRLVPDSEWAARVAEARERISAWSRGETSKGFFDRSGMEVNVRGKMPSETLEMYMDRADKTLSHELQHAAHEMDGIPPPKRGDFEWYRTDAREVDARNSANRNLLTPEERVEMPRANTQDVRPEEVHMDDKGGKSGGFKGWKAYRDAKKAAEAEAAAVAIVNAGITNAPPLSAADLADSRASAEWLKSHERRGLVTEGTLPHTGRPRFYSGNGFMEGDTSFQGDRFSSIVPVDFDAYHGDAEAYKKTGRWAVIPTVYPDADGVTRLHTVDAAESEYRKSGSHFGIFEGLENAETGAQWDHHKGNADWAERETKQAAKGGDNFGNFTNFLATDDVPESIFGIPVVQDEGGYTEKDIEFFKENPKAAGFYDTGEEDEEEIEEEEPRQAVGEGAGNSAPHVYEDETDKTILGWVSAQHNGLPGAPRLVSRASTRHFAGTNYKRGATWVTPADSPFGEVEYFLDLANGPGIRANRVVVRTPESRSPETAIQLADYILRHHDRGDGRFGAIDRNDLERELYLHMQALADSKSSPVPASEFSSPGANSDPGAALGSMLGQALANWVVRRHAEFTDIMHNDPKMDKLERQYGKWSDIREKHMSGKRSEEVK